MPLPGFVELKNSETGAVIERTPVDAAEIMNNDSAWTAVIEKASAPVHRHPDRTPARGQRAEPVKAEAPKAPVEAPKAPVAKDDKKAD